MAKLRSKKSQNDSKARRSLVRRVFGPVFLVVVATVTALALSEPLRNRALDLLFGSEEEFEYTPPAESAAPAENSASV